MVGYATLGTSDLERASAYYDALLAELGARRIMNLDRIIIWSNDPRAGMLGVCLPHNGQPAVAGNGVMVGLNAGSSAAVDRVHARALALGGSDEGAPGDRGNGFYAGYFRDPDGNKLVAYHLAL
jgi:catechol 2,3-dioxygenase-like lactoylglutathione lyase family enzyme